MRLRIVLIFTFCLLLIKPPIAAAQGYSWIIESFHSDIKIKNTGTVEVKETIVTNFQEQKHGIFRDIPYVYQTKSGEKMYTDIEVKAVFRDENQEKYTILQNGSNVQIKIGDPSKTLTGTQTYTIVYDVTGVLVNYGDNDELFWNATGAYWDVPIEKASASISTPQNIEVKNAICYQGFQGSRDTCTTNYANSKAQFEATSVLQSGEQISVGVQYKTGLVPTPIVQKPQSFAEKALTLQNAALALTTALFGLSTVTLLWWKKGRDFWWKKQHLFDPDKKIEIKSLSDYEPIIVEYEPPNSLRPAEIGVLKDERAQTIDVTATIVDLAARGYLSIKELPKKWMFGKVDYELTRQKKADQKLYAYEKELFNRLFDDGEVIKVSSLKTKFYKDLRYVKEKLYQHMTEKNYFPENPEKQRTKYTVLAIGTIVLGVGLIVFSLNAQVASLLAVGVGIVITGSVLFILAQFMPRRSASGREMYRRIKGYELFLENVEKHRQQFAEDKNLFNKILPYAIMFGLTEKLAKAMKDMGVEPSSPSWYSGTKTFTPQVLASNINNFSSSLSTAISKAPSSSGFSSSGGFSGGGFGGGGGGSW